jgi:AraC-like DNA-binding protein
VQVERHETETARWEVARRPTPAVLRSFVLSDVEGWAQSRGSAVSLREVPFPGVPLILNLGAPWKIDDARGGGTSNARDSFLAGLHTTPALVQGGAEWACIELRLTPTGAHRLIGRPMHELVNETVELEELVPAARLTGRLRETHSWAERFDLVEAFLAERLVDQPPPSPGVEWSWQRLRRTQGRVPIQMLARELGWSHRRLIARFREQIGLTPKMLARVIRFDRAVASLRAASHPALAEIAYECGYFDQAHLNRDFRELAGTSPTAFLARRLDSGGIAA